MRPVRPLLTLAAAGALAACGVGGASADLRDAATGEAAAESAEDAGPEPSSQAEPAGDAAGDGDDAADAAVPVAKVASEARGLGESEALAAEVAAPVAVTVPSVGIDSELVRLGLHDDGTMEVPTDFDLAGWYVHGPRPGELGPAVIAGHVDSVDGPAVFHRLGEVSAGDRIEVARADGSVAVFAVDAVEQHPKDEFPTKSVYDDLDHAGLRLITCTGDFDRPAGRYLDNLIVYASLVVP